MMELGLGRAAAAPPDLSLQARHLLHPPTRLGSVYDHLLATAPTPSSASRIVQRLSRRGAATAISRHQPSSETNSEWRSAPKTNLLWRSSTTPDRPTLNKATIADDVGPLTTRYNTWRSTTSPVPKNECPLFQLDPLSTLPTRD